jgi:hypothetical protein
MKGDTSIQGRKEPVHCVNMFRPSACYQRFNADRKALVESLRYQPPAFSYATLLTYHVASPVGVCTLNSSPTSFFNSALAMGESMEM